jgi:hypothetical protein
MRLRFRIPLSWILTFVIVAGLGAYIATHLQILTNDRTIEKRTAIPVSSAPKVQPGPAELPNEADFKAVGENDKLRLKFDAKTAHFIVEDKKDGRVWRSYPNPEQWANEKTANVWRTHLRSPIMLQYLDVGDPKDQPKETNLLEENGTLKDVQVMNNGFRLTFDMQSKGFKIPIEVKLENDSVTIRIIDSGIKEDRLSLIWVRLYPFFAAERSEGQDGYMFIPDGSGALIKYDDKSTNVNRIYREPVYGEDIAFKINSFESPRQMAAMPTYGAKNENRSFLAVLEDGAEFSDVIASPAGVFSTYNWVTGQSNYRASYKQVTNREKKRSFITYNKGERFHSDRVTRYFMLANDKSNYVGMAERYRNYLKETYSLQKVKPKPGKVPMDIVLLGADTTKGLLWDRYVKSTTTSEATQIVQRLNDLGIDNMIVRYWGWQEDGFGALGGLSQVDKRLGGDSGMKQFINFAHSLSIPVYLRTDYSENTTGNGGFRKSVQGMRDLGGTPILNLVSLKWFVSQILDKEIKYYKGLGVDGVELHGTGRFVNSDFNTEYGSSREDNRKLQQEVVTKLRKEVGHVMGYRSNFFAAPLVDSMARMVNDYSYDLFTQSGVPFAQIALHGLVPYSSRHTNGRDQFQVEFLHALEYGENPSYLFTYSSSDDLKFLNNVNLYNPVFTDWEQTAVQEYTKWNEALGDVQDQYIVGHREIAPQVKETTYENGKKIVINYSNTPYSYGGQVIASDSYLVVKGGTP